MPDLLERATGGRIISFSDRKLTAEEILKIHAYPFCTCPHAGCIEGTVGMAIQHVPGATMLTFIPCPLCEGAGEIHYVSTS